MGPPATADLDVRLPALRAGCWLGWGSVAAVLGGLALGLPARHPRELLALILVVAAANAVFMTVPWRRWLTAGRGQAMLDVWSGGLLALATLVVALGGARSHLDLLLFLIVPFLATVHRGHRRAAWLALAAAAFATTIALAPLAAGDVVLRLALLASATLLAVVLAQLTARDRRRRSTPRTCRCSRRQAPPPRSSSATRSRARAWLPSRRASPAAGGQRSSRLRRTARAAPSAASSNRADARWPPSTCAEPDVPGAPHPGGLHGT